MTGWTSNIDRSQGAPRCFLTDGKAHWEIKMIPGKYQR